MSFGAACYTLSPVIQKFNYDYLIADYKLTNSASGPVNIIRDNGEFNNNLINGTGNISPQFLSIQTPFSNNNIEYENSRQELIVYSIFSYTTLPPNSNIFYFSTDSNIKNLLNLDILQNSNIKVSYSNSNIGYYSNIINPLLELGEPPYNFIVQLYNGGSSNILDTIVLNSNNTIYNITRQFIPLHNIFDNYNKNTLSLGSSNINLYDFRVYNKFIPVSLPLPITNLVFISLTNCIILDTVNFRNIGINSVSINIDDTSINRVINNNIYIFELFPDTSYNIDIQLFYNYQNMYYTNQNIRTGNNASFTIGTISDDSITQVDTNLNITDIITSIGFTSVLYTNIIGINGIQDLRSYGINVTASNIGISTDYTIYTTFHADIYINSNNWNLTVNIANLERGNSYIPELIVHYTYDENGTQENRHESVFLPTFILL